MLGSMAAAANKQFATKLNLQGSNYHLRRCMGNSFEAIVQQRLSVKPLLAWKGSI